MSMVANPAPWLATLGRVPSVVHVTQPVDGGVAGYVQQLARAQAAAGWAVTVISPPEPSFAGALCSAGVAHVPWAAGRRPGAAVPREAASLRRLLGRAPSVVHLHSSKAGLAGRLVLRGRRPTVFQPHAWSFAALRGAGADAAVVWERVAARWADVILCVSEAERDRGASSGVHGDLRVVPNGVDLQRFSPAGAAARRAARLALSVGDGPLVVCVGRLCAQKGQDVLVRSWPTVRARVPPARLALVGDGPDRAALERAAAGGVHFAGEVADVTPWMAAADLVVAPSRWEGMPFSILEAMACGVSTVATDVEGAREALGPDGGIVPVGDVTALAGAVVRRLLDDDLRRSEGRALRDRAERGHDARTRLAEVMDLTLEVARAKEVGREGFEPP